jgi:hypothetical protein
MWGATLAEKVRRAATVLVAGAASASFGGAGAVSAGCASDHHVSPWGDRPGPPLAAFLRSPDLAGQLARIDAETAALRLARTEQIEVELPPRGSRRKAVLRGYEGRDVAGRPVHAVRVATPLGVVLAVGPLDPGDLDRDQPTELVPALAGEGTALAFRSGSDLNGDGSLDVVLRNDAGAISIWHFGELGAGPYAAHLAVPPTGGADVEGDGRAALWGARPPTPGDPIAPRLTDVATFTGHAYSDDTAAAKAWHAREASRPLPTGVSDTLRLRAALEHAWHAIFAGEARDAVLRDLRREPVPGPLRPSMEGHLGTLTSVVRP